MVCGVSAGSRINHSQVEVKVEDTRGQGPRQFNVETNKMRMNSDETRYSYSDKDKDRKAGLDKAGRLRRTVWPPLRSVQMKNPSSRTLGFKIAWRRFLAGRLRGVQCLDRDPYRLDEKDESESLQATLIDASNSPLPGVVTNTPA